MVRAFVQHRPPLPWKVWYVAPNFRYERPQKGRYRQHWQVGVEVLGVDDPDVDVEVDRAARTASTATSGCTRFRLLLNSMGDAESRRALPRGAARVLARPRRHARRRVRRGPRRTRCACSTRSVPTGRTMLERGAAARRAPLGRGGGSTSSRCRTGCRRSASRSSSRPGSCAGFDYYTGTTFEFASDTLDAAQNALGGGGRYDRLAEEMGGPPTPGIGFGIGIERVLLACDARRRVRRARGALDVFVVDGVGGTDATVLLDELRDAASAPIARTAAARSGSRWPRPTSPARASA